MAHKYGSNIPLARQHMVDCLKILTGDGFDNATKVRMAIAQISAAIPLMSREVLNPAKSHPNKPLALRHEPEVISMAKAGRTQQQIAEHFETGPGRVSEMLRRAKKAGRY